MKFTILIFILQVTNIINFSKSLKLNDISLPNLNNLKYINNNKFQIQKNKILNNFPSFLQISEKNNFFNLFENLETNKNTNTGYINVLKRKQENFNFTNSTVIISYIFIRF